MPAVLLLKTKIAPIGENAIKLYSLDGGRLWFSRASHLRKFKARRCRHDRAAGRFIAAYAGEDVMLPRQEHGRAPLPEQKLLLAILEDAIALIAGKGVRYGLSPWQLQTERNQAKAWIYDRRRWDPFSFQGIWTYLFPEWDLERAREAILSRPEEVYRFLQDFNVCLRR